MKSTHTTYPVVCIGAHFTQHVTKKLYMQIRWAKTDPLGQIANPL